MNFALTDEQQLIVDTVRSFVEKELYPHEEEVERTGAVPRELGRASMALSVFFGRPSGILEACEGEQREKYLLPAVAGEKFDALAMTEPEAGSDVRGMKCTGVQDGDVWINDFNVTPPEIPFGGYKESGLGRENGLEAVESYTQTKTVYTNLGDVEKTY